MSDILSLKQNLAIDALMRGAKIDTAAEASGVTTRTLHRWRQSPLFHAELERRAGQLLDDVTRQLGATMAYAPGILYELMTDTNTPPAVRLGAARSAIELHDRLFETRVLLARIEALEAR